MTASKIADLVHAVQTGAHAHLTPKELEKVLGSKFQHVRQINKAVRKSGLTVVERSQADRSHGIIRIKGTYAAFKRFSPGLVLHEFTDKKGNKVIAREGTLNVEHTCHHRLLRSGSARSGTHALPHPQAEGSGRAPSPKA